MRFQTLSDWLLWQEQLHPKSIDLDLARVREVWQRMQCPVFGCPVITVGGTNGKGSTVAMLESIYLAAGYRVGCYTSPHLWRYNERIRVDGQAVTDFCICDAFERVDQSRAAISLTYFEFGTLAALECFSRQPLDVILLEVGLGGRLDAVNIIDADVAMISSIDLDHTQWLGNSRGSIAREKAGILRAEQIGIVADSAPPRELQAMADSIGNRLLCLDRDFSYQQNGGSWSWYYADQQRVGLPPPALSGEHQLRNAAAVVMAIDRLQSRLPVSQAHLRAGLLAVRLPGRFQMITGPVTRIFDVAHNPAASTQLAKTLAQLPRKGTTLHAVFSALSDKDIPGLVMPMCPLVTHWHLAPLNTQRQANIEMLVSAVRTACLDAFITTYDTVQTAYKDALASTHENDIVLVFGSFYTVAQTCEDGL